MTTPGDGSNEIEFRTRIVPGGDEAQVARNMGERAGAAYSEGVRETGSVRMPPMDVSQMYDSIDAQLTRMEQRVSRSAETMGLHLQRSMGGADLRLGGEDLVREWERFQRDIESLGGRTRETWIGSFADAVRADVRRLEQGFDYADEVNRRGQRINWALNTEGRQALAMQGQPYSPGPGTDSFYSGGAYPTMPAAGPQAREAFEPGDLDRVRAKAMEAIGRITLDDATYALENGQFFGTSKSGAVMRARGPVDNPELLGRLQEATLGRLANVEDEITREHLNTMAQRDNRLSSIGIRDLGADYVYGAAEEAEIQAARREVDQLETKVRNLREQVAREYPRQQPGQQRTAMLSDIARYAHREGVEITPELAAERQGARISGGLQGRAFDPSRLAREAEVLRAGLAQTEEMLHNQLATARRRFAEVSSPARLPATDVAEIVQTDIARTPGVEGYANAIRSLERLQVQAPEVFDALRTQMVEIIQVEEQAARAADRQARATREASEEAARLAAVMTRLQAAFATYVDPDVVRASRENDAAHRLNLAGQARAAEQQGWMLPLTQAGGRGSGGEPPRPPTPLGTPDEFDENVYLQALRARRLMAEAAREEAQAQQAIEVAQDRAQRKSQIALGLMGDLARRQQAAAFESYGWQADGAGARARQNAAMATYEPNMPVARQATSQLAYEESQAIRRALGESAEAWRTVTLTAADLPQPAQALAREMTEAQKRLAAAPQVSIPAGQKLDAGEADRIVRETVGQQGRPIVRTSDGGYAEVAGGGKLKAITETEALARAERELADVHRSTAKAADIATVSVHDLTDQQRRLLIAVDGLKKATASGDIVKIARAENQVNAAQRAVDASERQPNTLVGFGQAAVRGFTMARGAGQGDNNAFLRVRAESGEFLGAIARYQAAYAIIFGLSQGFAALVRSEVQAQDVMIEFSHATGLAADGTEKLANSLGILGGQAGYSVAQSLQTATRAVFAFQEDIRRGMDPADVAREGVRQASNLSLIAPTLDPNQAQSQLIGATNGFQYGVEGQARVLDAATNAYRNYGGAVEDIIAALPTLSEVSRDAGLSVEEMANLVSVGVSRTAMNGTGIASLINRIFGNINQKPQIRGMLESLGIEADGSAGQVVYNLAAAWDTLGKAQRDQIVAALGGHETARALLPILSQGASLADANARSFAGMGAAQDLVNEKSENLAGLVRILLGDFQNFGRALFDSGIFDLAGAGLAALHPFMEGFNTLLRIIALMPGNTEAWMFALLEVSAVLAIIGKQMQANAAAQAATAAAAGGQAAANTASAGAGLLAGGVRGAAGNVRSGITGLLSGATGAAIALFGVTAAAGGLIEAMREQEDAARGVTAAQRGAADARTPDELRSSASALANADTVRQEAESGIFGFLGRQFRERTLREQPQAREEERDSGALSAVGRQARFNLNLADQIEEEAARLGSAVSPLGAHFSNTGNFAEDMASGIQSMTMAGVSAVDMLNNLTAALEDSGQAGQAAGVYANAGTVGGLSSAVAGAVQGFQFGAEDINDPISPMEWVQAVLGGLVGVGQPSLDADRTQSALEDFNPEDVQRRVQGVLDRRRLGPSDLINAETQSEIANEVVAALGLEDVLTGTARERLATEVRRTLSREYQTRRQSPIAGLQTQGDVDDYIYGPEIDGRRGGGQLETVLQDRRGYDPRRIGEDEALLTARANKLRTTIREIEAKNLDPGQSTRDVLAEIEHELAQVTIARLQRLRDAALAQTTDPAQAEAIRIDSTIEQVRTALAAGDDVTLLAVMDEATDAALDSTRAVLQAAYEAVRNAQEQMARLAAAAAETPGIQQMSVRARDRVLAGAQTTAVDNALAELERFDATREMRVPADQDTTDPAALARARIMAGARIGDPVDQARAARDAAAASRQFADTELEKINADREYREAEHAYFNAIRDRSTAMIADTAVPGDALSAAAVRLRQAEVTLSAAVGGTAEWAAANQALDEARFAYAEEQVNLANALLADSVRPGDPLSAARVAIQQAQNTLNQAVRGTAQWAAANQALDESRYALAQAELEAARNTRLLSTDITDPLERARVETETARARAARNAAEGTGDPLADQLAVREAEAGEEATANQQRFNAMQTAEELGRITHGAYMRYLDSEKTRLEAIANRTYEQQQFLDQIDSAIQAAGEAMNSQFNLGDIDIPTVYEARRYAQSALTPTGYMGTESALATASSAASFQSAATYDYSNVYDNRNVQIIIQGGNIDAVTQAVADATAVITTVGSRPRKY